MSKLDLFVLALLAVAGIAFCFLANALYPEHVFSIISKIFVFWFCLLIPAWIFWVSLRGLRENEERIAHIKSISTQLVPGYVVLQGFPRPEVSDGPLVSLTIEQRGTDRARIGSKGQDQHIWEETTRTLQAPPFYLKLATGELIRVEPQGQVFFVDALDEIHRIHHASRTKTARLQQGEETFVSGELVYGNDPLKQTGEQGSYRDAPQSLILRPPKGKRLLISTKPPTELFSKKAAHSKSVMKFILIFFGIVHGLIFAGYHQRLWFGEIYYSEDVSFYEYKLNKKIANAIKGTVVIGDGSKLAVDCHVPRSMLGTSRVPFLVESVFFDSYEVGTKANIRPGWLVFLSMAMIFSLLGVIPTPGEEEWYEKKKLDEVNYGRL